MPYAAEGQISQAPIEGGIEITDAQYADGLAGMVAGQLVTIKGGFAVIDPPEPEYPDPIPEPEPGVPQAVTPAQGLMALYVLHQITEDDIHTAIKAIEDATMRYQAMIAFTRATVWERSSEALGVVAQLMELTESDLDAAFTRGATYTNL